MSRVVHRVRTRAFVSHCELSSDVGVAKARNRLTGKRADP